MKMDMSMRLGHRQPPVAAGPRFGPWMVREGNTLSIINGVARSTETTTNPALFRRVSNLVVGATYLISIRGSKGTSTGAFYGRVSSDDTLTTVLQLFHEGTTDYDDVFTYQATGKEVWIGFAASAETGEYIETSDFSIDRVYGSFVKVSDFADVTINGVDYKAQTPGRGHSLIKYDNEVYQFDIRDGDEWPSDIPGTRNRSELSQQNSTLPASGADIWVSTSFAVMQTLPTQAGVLVSQMHFGFSGAYPPVDIYVGGESKTLRITTTYSGETDASNPERVLRYEAPAVPGKWYRVVYRVRFGVPGNAIFDCWVDGQLVSSITNEGLGYPNHPSFQPYYKEGAYRAYQSERVIVRHVNLEVGTNSLLDRVSWPRIIPNQQDAKPPAQGWSPTVSDVAAQAEYGGISVASDGSVGDTYTIDAASATEIQWYRMTLAAPILATAIAGATSESYQAQAADEGYRLAAVYVSDALLYVSKARQVVLPQLVLLDSFDDAIGFASSSTNLTLSVDAGDKIEGTGSLVTLGQGLGSRLIKTIGPLTDFPGIASLEDLGTIAWAKWEDFPYSMKSASSTIRLDRTGGTPSVSSQLAGMDNMPNTHAGLFWFAARPASIPYLQGLDPSASWRYSFDRSSLSANTPHAFRTHFDALVAKAQGRATVVLTFDDAFANQYLNALPILVDAGLKATWYLPTELVETGNGTGRLNLTQAQAIAAAGMDMQLDGTSDDAAITTKHADAAAAIAELKSMRAWMASNGLNPDARHFCYPNGYIDTTTAAGFVDDHRVLTVDDAVTTGNDIVTLSDTSALSAVMQVHAAGMTEGATIISVDSGTQVTLSENVPSGTTRITFWDDTSPFFLDKLQDAIRADGTFLTGRTTGFSKPFTRFGFGALDLLLPAYSISNGAAGTASDAELAANALARVDEAITEGKSVIFYLHGVEVGGTFIHTPLSTFETVVAGLVSRRDAGLIDVLTIDDLWQRDSGAILPLP